MAKFKDKNLVMEANKTVDGRDVSVDGEKLDAATEKNIAKTLVLRSSTGKADVIASNAEKLYIARTITFKGGAVGNFSFDGSKNLEVELEVNATAHNHNDLYYTIEEVDNKFQDFSPEDHKHKAITNGSGIEYFKWDASEPAIVQIRWGGSSGNYGTAQTVARFDHKHDDLYPSISQISSTYATKLKIDNRELLLVNNDNAELSRVSIPWALSLGAAVGSEGMSLNSTDLNTEPKKVVHTDSNGHVQFGWIKVTAGVTTNDPTYFFIDIGDSYLRKISPTQLFSNLGLSGNAVTQHGHNRFYTTSHPAQYITAEWDGTYFKIINSSSSKISVDHAVDADLATKAKYADYAEYYSINDPSVQIGSLLAISRTTEYELEECVTTLSSEVIGVRSTKPGFIINAKDEEKENMIEVALLGKTPVRILGAIEKGDAIVSSGKGCGTKLTQEMRKSIQVGDRIIIGYALETNLEVEEKLVMSFISK